MEAGGYKEGRRDVARGAKRHPRPWLFDRMFSARRLLCLCRVWEPLWGSGDGTSPLLALRAGAHTFRDVLANVATCSASARTPFQTRSCERGYGSAPCAPTLRISVVPPTSAPAPSTLRSD